MGMGTGGKVGIFRLSDWGLQGVTVNAVAASLFGGGIPLYATVVAVAVFACSAFTVVAGCALIVLYLRGDFSEEAGFLARLTIKTALFGVLAVASGLCARRYAGDIDLESDHAREPSESRATSRVLLGAAILVPLVLILPNLGAYPWPAPDELHHLVVARNIAEYGAYASGHPDGGLIYFDIYDSVGPPVILPVAAIFKVSGTELAGARLVIALSYLVLCVLVFVIMRDSFGPNPAALSVLMMTMAFGSIYLARSLYGEVPAFMFFMAGLYLWRRALDTSKNAVLLILAGLCFGLAVLTKTFILIGAWAFVGVWLYDRLTYRRIGFRHMALPFGGLLLALGAWAGIELALSRPGSGDESTLVYYRHSLMFGLDTLRSIQPQLFAQAFALIAAAITIAFIVPHVFRSRYDPALAVLLLLAALFAFWWLFFTPGRIPRYLWYSCAIAGIFAGPFLHFLSGQLRRRNVSGPGAVAAVCLVVVVVTGLIRTVPQLHYVLFDDRTETERQLARYIQSLPEGTTIATTYWPAQRSVNFLANRHIDRFHEPHPDYSGYDTVIFSERMPPVPPAALEHGKRLGHYYVFSPGATGKELDHDH